MNASIRAAAGRIALTHLPPLPKPPPPHVSAAAALLVAAAAAAAAMLCAAAQSLAMPSISKLELC